MIQLFYGVTVLFVCEGERETSFLSLLNAVETHGAQLGAEAQRVLLELSEELSHAGEDFNCFCIFALLLQRLFGQLKLIVGSDLREL